MSKMDYIQVLCRKIEQCYHIHELDMMRKKNVKQNS